MAFILAMCGFSLAMSISPGPVNVLSLSSGANNGFLKTFPFVSGATIGFTLLLVATGLGVSEILEASKLLFNILMYSGCIFIVYMGWQLANSRAELSFERVHVPSFIDGFMLQWLNPKAWAACLAGVSAFSADTSSQNLLIFSSIYFVICYLSIGLWAYVGYRSSRLLLNAKRLRVFNGVMGGGLIAVAVYLLVQNVFWG